MLTFVSLLENFGSTGLGQVEVAPRHNDVIATVMSITSFKSIFECENLTFIYIHYYYKYNYVT